MGVSACPAEITHEPCLALPRPTAHLLRLRSYQRFSGRIVVIPHRVFSGVSYELGQNAGHSKLLIRECYPASNSPSHFNKSHNIKLPFLPSHLFWDIPQVAITMVYRYYAPARVPIDAGNLVANNLNVAGKSCPVPKHTEKQQIPRSHGFRDPEVVRVGRTHLPVAYPRSDLTSLRYPSPPRLRITGRLTPV